MVKRCLLFVTCVILYPIAFVAEKLSSYLTGLDEE